MNISYGSCKNRPSILFRPENSLFRQIKKAAEKDEVSMNHFLNKAMREFLKNGI